MTASPRSTPRHIPIVDLAKEYQEMRSELAPVVESVLSGGSYILGEHTHLFEKELAAYVGVQNAIGVNSGTDAIQLAIRTLNIGPGDEVIVPAMTFIATAEPVALSGARPVFVDIDPVSYNLSPASVRQRVTARTKAIIAVHLYGQPADLDSLHALAQERSIVLIEDMAQAIGAEFGGRKVGSFGRMACVSFFPTKNLGAYGDGGAILTSDAPMAARLRHLRNHGASKKYHHEEVGYNTRLDELQAAILRIKLRRLDAWNTQRRRLAQEYDRLLDRSALQIPQTVLNRTHIFHLYCIRTRRRDALAAYLADQGIATGLHYPTPLHLQPAFRSMGGKRGDCPESEALSQEVLSLPLYPQMSMDDVAYVAQHVRQFLNA